MIIAEHHRPGHWLAKEDPYAPAYAWPEKCYVQWGGAGVVLSKNGNYRTAFFEAFPGDNAGGFIRGEGSTLSEAEAVAFANYTRETACVHRWGRKSYTNGGALCYHCGAFKTVFKAIHVFGDWRKPLSKMEVEILGFDLPGDREIDRKQYRRKLELRRKVFGDESAASSALGKDGG